MGVASTCGHSVADLQRVISAMRKVVEKLQSENERLKKEEGRGDRETGRVRQLEEENKKLKVGGKERGREGGMDGGREGGRERGREGGRKGRVGVHEGSTVCHTCLGIVGATESQPVCPRRRRK